jgi:hypothetical protein
LIEETIGTPTPKDQPTTLTITPECPNEIEEKFFPASITPCDVVLTADAPTITFQNTAPFLLDNNPLAIESYNLHDFG